MIRLYTYKLFVEGVRDKMTPKSEEEVKSAFVNLINSIDNPVNTMAPEWQEEFQKLADIIGVPTTDLHIIDEDKLDYALLDEYFGDLVLDEEKKEVEISPDGDFAGGTYTCYPSQKLIYWSSNVHDDLHVWIFSKSHFTKLD